MVGVPQNAVILCSLIIFNIKKGYGFSVDLWKDRLDIVDYFHGETRASFRILSVEETDDMPTERLFPLE
jgi:hypothetical protein